MINNQKQATLPTVQQVEEFHRVFGLTVSENWDDRKSSIDIEELEIKASYILEHLRSALNLSRNFAKLQNHNKDHYLRIALSIEELIEFIEALTFADPVEILDALVDRQYVLDGDFVTYGMHKIKEQAFHHVHQSNMSKLGADGKPIIDEGGKIQKGPNYWKPQLELFL